MNIELWRLYGVGDCGATALHTNVAVHEKNRYKSKIAILDNAHLKVQTLCYFMLKPDLPNRDKITFVWDYAVLFSACYSSWLILVNSAETSSSSSHHHLSLNCEGHWGTPVFFIFPVLLCPLGPAKLQACPFPDVVFPPLPQSALCSSPFHCALQDGFGQTWWMEDMTIPLQSASLCDGQEVFMWSSCLLDLGTDFLITILSMRKSERRGRKELKPNFLKKCKNTWFSHEQSQIISYTHNQQRLYCEIKKCSL